MTTFAQLKVGDSIWLGHRQEDSRTIKGIGTTPKGGIIILFTNINGIPGKEHGYDDRVEVGPSKLNLSESHRNGDPDDKFFACREAAVENEIAKHRHVIHCIEGEIEMKREQIAKHRKSIVKLGGSVPDADKLEMTKWSELALMDEMLDNFLENNGSNHKFYYDARALRDKLMPALTAATDKL
jgi:hypothetical protein